MRYTIYGKAGVFDAERFIDVMQAFENFITAAKSGGGEDMKGNMAGLGAIGFQPSTGLVPAFPMAISQPENPIQARAALGFLLSDKGDFFREFILDEVSSHVTTVEDDLRSSHCTWCSNFPMQENVPFQVLLY